MKIYQHPSERPKKIFISTECFILPMPENVLIKIFSFLPYKDLWNLTATCKYFNEIISKSMALLANKRISFTFKNRALEWSDNRMYTKFLVDSFMMDKFIDVAKISGSNLKVLHMNLLMHDVKLSEVKAALVKCVNLVEIHAYFNNIDVDIDNSCKNVPLKKLKILEFHGISKAFKIFMNARVETFKLRRFKSEKLDIFKEFLNKHKSTLTELKLYDYHEEHSLFDDDKLAKVKFRLTKLALINTRGLEYQLNFNKFVQNHVKSLTHMRVKHCEGVLLSFTNFTNLTHLKLRQTNSNFNPLPSVTHLKLENYNGTFVPLFPNVTHLTIIDSFSFFFTLDLSSLTKLVTLDISESHISELHIPQVQNLTLNCAVTYACSIFNCYDVQFEHLTINHCKNINWLATLLQRQMGMLKTLEINESSMSAECMRAVMDYDGLIQVKNVINCQAIFGEVKWRKHRYCNCDDCYIKAYKRRVMRM